MGGVVARGVLARLPTTVLLVTLATPHAPLLLLDAELGALYEAAGVVPANSTIVSVAGGPRDVQVRTGLTRVRGALHVNALAAPAVWLSADHLAICWCNELVVHNTVFFFCKLLSACALQLEPVCNQVLAITRALFDALDRRTVHTVLVLFCWSF